MDTNFAARSTAEQRAIYEHGAAIESVVSGLSRMERRCIRDASLVNWRGAGRHWPHVRRSLVAKGLLDSEMLLTAAGAEAKTIIIEEARNG